VKVGDLVKNIYLKQPLCDVGVIIGIKTHWVREGYYDVWTREGKEIWYEEELRVLNESR
jgi:hypothetical protein